MRTTPRLQEPYSSSAWDPSGDILFLGSFDSYYSIQQLRTDNWPACISTWKTGTAYRTEALALSPEGQKLVRMTDEDIIEVFDVSTKALTTTITMPSRPLSIEISWDSRKVLVNTQEEHLQVLELETGDLVDSYKGPTMRTEYIVRAVFGAPQDEFVLSAAEGETSFPRIGRLTTSSSNYVGILTNHTTGEYIYLWDRKTGDILARLEGHSPRSNDVAWNPVNPYMFASVGDDGKLKMQVYSHVSF